jgi:hypothetical protein
MFKTLTFFMQLILQQHKPVRNIIKFIGFFKAWLAKSGICFLSKQKKNYAT